MAISLVGGFDDRELDGIRKAAAAAGMTVHASSSAGAALGRLRGGTTPVCVIVGSSIDLKRFVEDVRDEAQLFSLPVLACVEPRDVAAFGDAFVAGVDDVVVSGDSEGITRRLGHLARLGSDRRPEANLGRVVVCIDDIVARRRVGRTLRQAGFDIEYASDLERLRTPGVATPLFAVAVGTPPGDVEHRRVSIGDVARVGLVPVLFLDLGLEYSPRHSDAQIVDATGRLLFFADERVKAEFKDRRGSVRKLFATVCSFREPGSPAAIFGATYNVSRDGMYVRTFDPPRPGTSLWIELRAPETALPLHLRGTVVWQRLPGAGKGVLPPGFGLSLNRMGSPSEDYREFLEGYVSLSG
jgi:hypothetical protein